tara:strand:+ start:198 stop:443 length:246 start_codon:yes stop_codon:yes gene_type:complete
MAFGTLNVGVLTAGDASLSVTLGTNAGNDFSVGSGKLLVEGDTKLVSIGTGGDLETSTTGNMTDRGSCFHSTTNRNLVFGY